MTDTAEDRPARFLWLPPGLRPRLPMTWRQERVFLLVGITVLFAGYDMNVYGLAIPQIQASLHIPENQVGLTVTYFRIATLAAVFLAASADVVGRRRLLLFTIFGQGLATLATAFAGTYAQFVWLQIATRVFGYAEEMLCIVVIIEEVSDGARGWATGTLTAMNFLGAGIASLAFAAVTILPYGWRSMYVIGAVPILLVGILRRRMPETKRFEVRRQEIGKVASKISAGLDAIRRLATEYPRRLIAIVVFAAAWGFAIGPATVLGSKYLQQTLGYAPHQAVLIMLPGGLVALALNILTGRISDRLGRKRTVLITATLAGICYTIFYSGLHGAAIPPIWVLAFYGFFATDALFAGYTTEIMPTAYRATVSGLRYMVEIMMGGLSLGLEGVFYDRFGAHGPAISIFLLTIPIALIAVLFLPEPAGRRLEEISAA